MTRRLVPSWVRTALRRIRRAPDRYLHPLRRAGFRRALATYDRPSILVVCLGNICRSPYAAHRLRADFAARGVLGMEIVSAGFVQPDRPSPPEALRAAARRGLDLSTHVSIVLDGQIVDGADLILVMSRRQRRDVVRRFGRSEGVFVLGDGDPLPIEARTMKDPVDKHESVFDVVYDRVDRCCGLVISSLAPEALERSVATDSREPDAETSRDNRPIRMVAGR